MVASSIPDTSKLEGLVQPAHKVMEVAKPSAYNINTTTKFEQFIQEVAEDVDPNHQATQMKIPQMVSKPSNSEMIARYLLVSCQDW